LLSPLQPRLNFCVLSTTLGYANVSKHFLRGSIRKYVREVRVSLLVSVNWLLCLVQH